MRRAVLLALTLVVALPGLDARAAPPRDVRLSFAEVDAAHTMTAAWNSTYDTDESKVRYGLTANYGLLAEGTSRLLPGGMGYQHEVTIDGLEPDTVYHYSVGGDSGWSGDLTFRTAPREDGCTPFSFVALGDNRSDDGRGSSPKWSPILGEALQWDPGFVLNTGDLVKDGHETGQWLTFLSDTSPHASLVPFMPSMGNHDDGPGDGESANYNMLFALPRNDVSGTEDYYYFLYGNAIVVSLSTVSFSGGERPFQEQADWLDRVLTENPRPWKFVFFHHPPYTGWVDLFGWDVNHAPNEADQNPALVPVLDKHHVDIVFNGHNHFYQRFAPMVFSEETPEEGVPVTDFSNGTVYAVTGGAGALTYTIELYMWALNVNTPGSEVVSGKHHYVLVEIDGNELNYAAILTNRQLFGTEEHDDAVIDSFTIVKDDYEPVCTPVVADPGMPVDAGATDAGVPDAGAPDAGTTDGGSDLVEDTGAPEPDLGPPPVEDTGAPEPDQGPPPVEDTGAPAPKPDTAPEPQEDTTIPSGGADAGQVVTSAPSADGGCAAGGPAGGSGWVLLSLLFLAVWALRRRARA